MGLDLLGGVLAFALGGALAFVNFRITRRALRRGGQSGVRDLSILTVLRQVINVAYLVILYFLAPALPFQMLYLLVGGVLGLTIPMLLLSYRLVREAKTASGIQAKPQEEEGGEN